VIGYVLDTTIVSALMRSEPEASARMLATPPDDVRIPQPVLAEIAYGLARLPRSRRKKQLEERFEIIAGSVARAPWTDDVSQRFGALKAQLERRGQRVDDFDIAIAAHALSIDATVVTRNLRHFERMADVVVEDWLE
jgi:tRNA(fMet)-specific endonuclease VapC